jgi:hypothetical protein
VRLSDTNIATDTYNDYEKTEEFIFSITGSRLIWCDPHDTFWVPS